MWSIFHCEGKVFKRSQKIARERDKRMDGRGNPYLHTSIIRTISCQGFHLMAKNRTRSHSSGGNVGKLISSTDAAAVELRWKIFTLLSVSCLSNLSRTRLWD